MYFTPTIFIVQLLAAMQVLMTLDMPLSTTMALPVTSKPIESTVENLAWQAWIELPPEQKQQVKSRKVTPKSIFTLPLRVECPQGHKQVDSKCIPIAIGSNDVLIDLNALGLLVGNTHTDDIYDYDDMGDEEMGSSLPYASDMPPGIEADKSMEGITVELKPPSKDEPLKFNIFENKFNIFHEEPMEDYSALSNEGLQSAEKDQTTKNETLMGAVNVNATTINDLLSESSNISENNFEIYVQKLNGSQVNASSYDKVVAINTLTTLANEEEFKIDAISVPAAGFDNQNSKILSVIQNDTSIQLVTNIMDTEPTTATKEHKQEVQENDLQTLLQTESFLPLMQQATATTLLDHGKLNETASLTTVQDQETSESTVDNLKLNIDEEMTTLPNLMDSDLEKEKAKQEFTRSVTMLPLIANESDNDNDNDDEDEVNSDNENNDVVNETTLATETNDEPLETTTPIQLDDTTIIETSLSSLSTTPATQKQQQMELKELLMQQEQTQKDFEELQRMRKGQKDKKQQQQQQQQQHHIILKKSKVEPVELVANTKATLTDTKITNNILTLETSTLRSSEELSTASSSSSSIAFTAAQTDETVTPLLTVHNNENNNNNNNNNDRFYYQHFGKQDSEETQSQQLSTAATSQSFTQTTELETMPLTSEIDLAEELRLINELVKGIKPATTLTTIKTMQTSTTSTTTTTTTEKPLTKEESQSTTVSSTDVASESSLVDNIKTTPSTAQIWSKIMPLLTTSTTQATPKQISERSSIEGQESNDIPTTATTTNSLTSPRSNRNSKIIRLNNFNTVAARKIKPLSESSTSTTTTTTTAATQLEDEESMSSSSSSSGSSSDTPTSATENNTYEPYWWLPVAWRFDKPTSSTSEKPLESVDEVKTEEQPLLLRFWSAYHAPKSSS